MRQAGSPSYSNVPGGYFSGHCNGQRFTYAPHPVSIQQGRLFVQVGRTRCAKDTSNTRGFAGAPRAAGLRHGCGQRLEPPRHERRRAVSLLPPGSPDSGAVSGRSVGFSAEAGCFLAAAAGCGSCHGPCFFADLASRASLRLVPSPKRFLFAALFVSKFS